MFSNKEKITWISPHKVLLPTSLLLESPKADTERTQKQTYGFEELNRNAQIESQANYILHTISYYLSLLMYQIDLSHLYLFHSVFVLSILMLPLVHFLFHYNILHILRGLEFLHIQVYLLDLLGLVPKCLAVSPYVSFCIFT